MNRVGLTKRDSKRGPYPTAASTPDLTQGRQQVLHICELNSSKPNGGCFADTCDVVARSKDLITSFL